ncbi:hypothetical protein [Actinomycetospora sp. CA-053990]|uniref:hypothetical protein n=1 Tax=Actinomycetospora sp. CA-053990 TaxID=3239891 RepID=UPI003D8FED70
MSDLNDPRPPEPARPLSDEEEAVLARLEADLAQDPGPEPEPAPPEVATRPGPRPRTLLVQVVVVVALAVVLAPSAAVGAVIAVVVLAGPIAASLWALRGTAGSPS